MRRFFFTLDAIGILCFVYSYLCVKKIKHKIAIVSDVKKKKKKKKIDTFVKSLWYHRQQNNCYPPKLFTCPNHNYVFFLNIIVDCVNSVSFGKIMFDLEYYCTIIVLPFIILPHLLAIMSDF